MIRNERGGDLTRTRPTAELDDVQRRSLDNLRTLLADITRRIEEAEKQTFEVLPAPFVAALDHARGDVRGLISVIDTFLPEVSG